MKIAIITDTHFGARNDSPQFNAFFKQFYDTVFFPFLKESGIKTVFHLGDVFDRRKYVNFNSLKSCKKYFFEPLRAMGVDMYVIPGNHDTYFKNTNDINSLDLLLREYQNITIFESPTRKTFDNVNFTFIPWLCSDNYESSMRYIKKSSGVCIGHFELDGFEMFRGVKNDGGLDRKYLKHFSKVLTGHFHHRSTNDNVYYLGSPYGFTWSDYDDARGFHVFDTETEELFFYQNPAEIFHKIYYNDTKEMDLDTTKYKNSCVKVIVVHKTDFLKFDTFIESLYANDVEELTIHEDLSQFEEAAIETDTIDIEDTMSLLSDFVDATDSAKDKERLKTLLKTLYVESQTLET